MGSQSSKIVKTTSKSNAFTTTKLSSCLTLRVILSGNRNMKLKLLKSIALQGHAIYLLQSTQQRIMGNMRIPLNAFWNIEFHLIPWFFMQGEDILWAWAQSTHTVEKINLLYQAHLGCHGNTNVKLKFLMNIDMLDSMHIPLNVFDHRTWSKSILFHARWVHKVQNCENYQ